MKIEYDIIVPSEYSAGIRGYSDTVIINIDSGDPGGEPGEFQEFMRQALLEWYDGGNVTIDRICTCG